MYTLFLILLAATAYFLMASRIGETECVEAIDDEDALVAELVDEPAMYDLLTIEPEREDDGHYHAAIIDIGEDAVLHVTDSFRTVEDAVKAAQEWIAAFA